MSKQKILVVDDLPANIYAMKTLLKDIDVEVISALSGNEALTLTLDNSFALILLDVNMPGMDGFEVAEILKDDPKTCAVPIIFVTAAFKEEFYQLRGYEAGAVDYIEKPINEMFLKSKVKIFLDLDQSRRDLEKQNELKNLALNKEIEATKKSNMLAREVQDSNEKLIASLDRLQLFQSRLIDIEEMAALGNMVAGVAHEINTPIGVSVTASTSLMDSLRLVRELFDEKKLTQSALQTFFDDGKEACDIIYRNLNRSSELIKSFKQLAVDQASEELRSFNVAELISDILMTLRPELRKTHHSITVDCPESLTVKMNPGPLNQIIINLIMNSIIHGFETIDKGEIHIRVNIKDCDLLCLNFQDNGIGASQEVADQIFRPFFTTKRDNGGSGLGMHILYNLVVHVLSGKVDVKTQLNEGMTFVIEFPVSEVAGAES